MQHESELRFFQKLLSNLHLPCYILPLSSPDIPEYDMGLRALLYQDADYAAMLRQTRAYIHPATIYCTPDQHMCRYILFLLPDAAEDTLFLIGPYSRTALTRESILQHIDTAGISPILMPQLEKYYQTLPLIPDESILFSLLNTLGETIWESADNFTIEYADFPFPDYREPFPLRKDTPESESPMLSMKILETRYTAENALLLAVSQGLVHKAEMVITQFSGNQMEQRLTDPVRNMKNYCIILNTLLRKAAESGSVHPLHIDTLSSAYARKIELLNSVESARALQREMIHKYCLLVKNHSMKGYSLLVRKAMICIDSDLTADLNLRRLAEQLNVNPSYLSTLFRKDTGTTLTDYVNRKRVDQALFLLNTTNTQVQTIAQYCGIPDVNYFTKIFKKYIGKTPKEYREGISPHSS